MTEVSLFLRSPGPTLCYLLEIRLEANQMFHIATLQIFNLSLDNSRHSADKSSFSSRKRRFYGVFGTKNFQQNKKKRHCGKLIHTL